METDHPEEQRRRARLQARLSRRGRPARTWYECTSDPAVRVGWLADDDGVGVMHVELEDN